jgi:hypothetical protein
MARQHDRPATIAAAVNAVVVYALPILVYGLLSQRPGHAASTTVTADDPDRMRHFLNQARPIVAYAALLAPFAMTAAWRTFVHARQWLAHHDRRWQGVLEAGAAGLAGTVLVLLPGIVTHPLQAPAYVVGYSVFAVPIGLAFGLVLRFTALAVLKLLTWRAAPA